MKILARLALTACSLMAAGAIVVALKRQPAPPSRPVRQPNIVVILMDDLGWADVAPYGSTFYETPAITRLARQGVRFTNYYAAGSVCSPTRASLWTGRYPARIGITDWIGGNDTGAVQPPANVERLPLDEYTLGKAFRDAGYATGYIGKWHLGTGDFMPGRQGFTFTKAVNRAGQPAAYFFPYKDDAWEDVNVPDLADGKPGEYLTDRLTDEALTFIAANRARPFLLVLSHYAVHTPLQSKPGLSANYKEKAARLFPGGMAPTRPEHTALTRTRQDHSTYAGMVESMDDGVGRVVAALEASGLAGNTLVVFTSDNGGLSTLVGVKANPPTANEPLRAGKGWLYEGGIRVPLIVSGPGVAGGGRAEPVPAISTDLYPTLLGLASIPLRPSQHVDGVNMAPVLDGGAAPSRDALYWHFPHYHGSGSVPSSAVRSGDWKLIEWLEDGRVELYNLRTDPSERSDQAAAQPAVTADLKAKLNKWRADVGAKMPTPLTPKK